ncbi:MAG: hypothetical protein ABJN18_15010, partial [Marinobacter sp.]
ADVPRFVAFVQPVLLIVAISLYSTAVRIANVLVHMGQAEPIADDAERRYADANTQQRESSRQPPLDLPRRTESDGY